MNRHSRAGMPPRALSAVAGASVLLLAAILSGLLAGCTPGDDPDARFDDYLARTLDADRPAAAAPARIHYPAGRDLQPTARGRDSRQVLTWLAGAGGALADGKPLSADALAKPHKTLEYSTYGGQLEAAARLRSDAGQLTALPHGTSANGALGRLDGTLRRVAAKPLASTIRQ